MAKGEDQHARGRFVVLCGPTAGGKSALAVRVAQSLGAKGRPAEIVTADALQVYRGMDIGTAKPTLAERGGVTHHLLDLVDPSEGFTVERWLALAEGVIADCAARGVTAVVVGGTHLYVKALLDGLFEGPGADAGLRAELGAMDALARRAELERVDPAAAARIHFNDVRRTVRALEVFRLTGRPISSHQGQWDGAGRSDALLVTLKWDVEAINRRINARVRAMINAGLVEEVAGIIAGVGVGGGFGPQAREGLGYKQLLAWMAPSGRGNGPDCPAVEQPTGNALDEIIERIKIDTRRFAKSQRTWLKRLSLTPGTLVLEANASLSEAERLEGWTTRVLAALDADDRAGNGAAGNGARSGG